MKVERKFGLGFLFLGTFLLWILIEIEFWFLLGLSLIVIFIGIVLIAATSKKESNVTVKAGDNLVAKVKVAKENSNTISHESEEYRKWKEGK